MLLAALAVILGAFGAHALKSMFETSELQTFDTGVRYQMYHSFAIIIAAILYKEFSSKLVILAGKLFFVGIVLFSVSLYALTFVKYIGATSFLWIGAITPLGGIFFVLAWSILFIGIYKNKV
ncbi:MAG: DUF423 domain-containing protein [Ferruginibacter sp.]|nr:DUF423 domain-containing protein [Ferruginibacter sp.]